MKTYLVAYEHNGQEASLELRAKDAADAKARLKNLANAQLLGELKEKLPVIRRPAHSIAATLKSLAR